MIWRPFVFNNYNCLLFHRLPTNISAFAPQRQVALDRNNITAIPAGFLAGLGRLREIELEELPLRSLGRAWLGPSNLTRTLSMKSPQSTLTCTTALKCSCLAGYVGGSAGFCVKPCSATIVDARRSLQYDTSQCPGFVFPEDLWPGGRPCVINSSFTELNIKEEEKGRRKKGEERGRKGKKKGEENIKFKRKLKL